MPSFEQNLSTNLDRLEAALDDLQTQSIQAVDEVTIYVERLKHSPGHGDSTPNINRETGNSDRADSRIFPSDEGVVRWSVTGPQGDKPVPAGSNRSRNGFSRTLPFTLATNIGSQESVIGSQEPVQGCPEEERSIGRFRVGDEGGKGAADGLLPGVHHHCNEPYSPDTVRLQSEFEDPSRRVVSLANLFLKIFVIAAIVMLAGSSLRFFVR